MKNLLKLLLSVTLIINLASCKKDNTTDPMPNTPTIPTPTADHYLIGVFDEEPVLVEANNGTSSESYSDCNLPTDAFGGAWVDIDFSTFDQTNLAFAYMHIVVENSYDELNEKFVGYEEGEKGIYDCENDIFEGGEIIYKDDNDVYWTSNGTQDADAYFEILERNGTWTGDIFTSNAVMEVKGKFSCRLYDSNGNSKMFTDGEFKSLFNFIM